VASQNDVPPDLSALARALTQRRLLVVKLAAHVPGVTAVDAATLEVAHEALLRRWPMLAELLTEDRDALLLLDGVLSAAADWHKAQASHKSDFLAHRGSRLIDAQALALRGPDWERQVVAAQEYLRACHERQNAISAYKNARISALESFVRTLLEQRIHNLEKENAELVASRSTSAERRYHSIDWSTEKMNEEEINTIRNFLKSDGRWHPQEAVYTRNAGPRGDYAEIYHFPCCGLQVITDTRAPQQFRSDGCCASPESETTDK
jgi:hypothetical protein